MTATLSIDKLLKTSFPGKTPWRVTPDNQQAVLDQIQNHIKEWNRSRGNIGTNNGCHLQLYNQTLQISIHFDINRKYYWQSDLNLVFKFDDEQRLIMESHRNVAFLNNLDELTNFLKHYQTALQQEQAQETKRQKLRDLKVKAVVARVRQIAKEDGFDYAVDTSPLRIILYVRLDEKKCVRISIPFTQFQDILPNLRTNIRLMRELNAGGINFQTTQALHTRRLQWVDHRTIED